MPSPVAATGLVMAAAEPAASPWKGIGAAAVPPAGRAGGGGGVRWAAVAPGGGEGGRGGGAGAAGGPPRGVAAPLGEGGEGARPAGDADLRGAQQVRQGLPGRPGGRPHQRRRRGG